MLAFPIDTLVFDLDNTLIDRNRAMLQAVNKWLAQQMVHEHVGREADDFDLQWLTSSIMKMDDWGYTDRNEFAAWLMREMPSHLIDGFTGDSLKAWFWEQIPLFIEPARDVIDCLKTLGRSYRLLLATNGGGNTQRAKLRQASLEELFSRHNTFISGEMGVAKPDPLFYTRMIERSQVEPARSLFIGDHPLHDVAGPASAGFRTCWVSHNRPSPDNFKPDLIITHITKLTQWL